ncbi:MAG: hypothetical protein AAFP80_12355 [Pseudomonadota bacterium]
MTTRPKKTPSVRTRRKPVTIDMKAEKAEPVEAPESAEVPGAEPVAMTNKEGSKTTPATKEEPNAKSESRPKAAPMADSKQPAKARSGSSLVGGLVGGAIALLGAAGLQWSGFIPNLGAVSVDTSAIEAEIAALNTRVDAAESSANAGADLDAVAVRLDELRAASSANTDMVGQLASRVDDTSDSVAQLTTAIEGGEAGDGAALEAITTRIAELQSQNDELVAQLAELSNTEPTAIDLSPVTARLDALEALGDPSEALAALEASTGETMNGFAENLQGISADVAALKDQVAAGGADSTAVARAFAASSLKNAVDRGGAFGAELEAFATVAQDVDGEAIATLRGFASGGVPTLSQLVDAYPAVANSIISSERTIDESAGIGQRLLNNMQGLVSVRPIDEQAGDTPTAISTRIGARLNEGDLNSALSEWEALPEVAKSASQDFIDQLRARRTVDGLLSNILTSAMSGTASTQ